MKDKGDLKAEPATLLFCIVPCYAPALFFLCLKPHSRALRLTCTRLHLSTRPQKSSTTSTSAVPASTSAAAPASTPSQINLANCATLILDSLNLYWEVQGNAIIFGLEGRGGSGTWMAFGVPPDPEIGNMVGSDVTVVGNINGSMFAQDYYLSCKPLVCNLETSLGTIKGVS